MKQIFSLVGKNGSGKALFRWQKKRAAFLATSGSNPNVTIFDRNGQLVAEIPLPGACCGMEWDCEGDVLAVIHSQGSNIFLWDANTQKVSELDMGMKAAPTFLSWSQTGSQLAVGTNKGNLFLYDHKTARKIPLIGKHNKAITTGQWTKEGLLCLGSNGSVTVNNNEGGLVMAITISGEPTDLQVYNPPQTSELYKEGPKLSVAINNETLFLTQLSNQDNQIDLAFQPKYGQIVTYRWFGDGKIMIGFSTGKFVVVSAHSQQLGQELFNSPNHKSRLADAACSLALNKAATCGDNTVKVHDLTDLTDVFALLTVEDDKGQLDKIQWSDDGQLLSVSTDTGVILTYITQLPTLGKVCASKIAHLTSLQEMSVTGFGEDQSRFKIKLPTEPTAIAVGPTFAASAMNNNVWFFAFRGGVPEPIKGNPKPYVGSVKDISLSADYAAVLLSSGQLQLHVLEGKAIGNAPTSRLFPDESKDEHITCMALTSTFAIYATKSGTISYFNVEDWQFANEFSHVTGIRYLASDKSGTRLVFFDEKADGFVYSPVNDVVVQIPDLPIGVKGALWDSRPADKGTFIAYDGSKMYTYVFAATNLRGPKVFALAPTTMPHGFVPLLLTDGRVTGLNPSGKLSTVILESHKYTDVRVVSVDQVDQAVRSNTRCGRFKEAYVLAASAPQCRDALKDLCNTALEWLEIEQALQSYRALGNASMVNTLSQLKTVEDKSLLAGHVALLLGDQDLAQTMFLKSSAPIEALNMHRDLLHWEQALKLAQKLAPAEIPHISYEYALQLEYSGEFARALQLYESSITRSSKDRQHDEACRMGRARMLVKTGDVKGGLKLAEELNSKALYRDLALSLEAAGNLAEAATMYEKAEMHDRAAAIYIKTKTWGKAGELMRGVSSAKLQMQYAKAREAEGSYKEAAQAYDAAKDYVSVVRINLEHLQNPDEAVRVVKRTGSVEGAKLVAKFFETMGDFGSAIQFLVMSQCSAEAFKMAQDHNRMDIYAKAVGEGANLEDLQNIALNFEKQGNTLEAGKFFSKAGEHAKAVKYLLSSQDVSGENIEAAIEAVGAAKDPELTKQLIDYLLGEIDGVPKEPKYLFRLYLQLRQFENAAQTAVVIAREEQAAGNYRNAHDVLLDMYLQLRNEKIRIPAEMTQSLLILHSYILVKLHVKRADHTKGARMLIRVANNISKFPAHMVNILTSTVIECHRSGLKNSAFIFAAMLLRPEFRNQVDAKYKKKIEQIVRKPEKSETPEDETPCPYCQHPVAATKLVCTQCDNMLPYCIASGQHMVESDWSECPHCAFPALYSEFSALMQSEENCPMCAKPLTADKVVKVLDPASRLKEFKENVEKSLLESAPLPEVSAADMQGLGDE
eukprot:m.121269 g.121269  ORF g.121269 m.121269 type:complete len:1367 (-) comp16199_c0_seq2:1475-5575(-)